MSMQALKKMLVPILLLCGGSFSQFAVIYVITLVKNCIYQASSLAGIFVRSSRIAHLLLSLDIEFNGMAFGSVPCYY